MKKLSPRGLPTAVTLLLAMSLGAHEIEAQTSGTTFTACRVPDVGAIYMIGVSGAPSACLDETHVEFSWTEGSGSLTEGSVTTTEILDGTIASVDIGADAVTSAEILDGTVATADIAADAVTSAEIWDGTVANADLAADAVNSSNIVDGSITSADIAADAVTSAEIADGSVSRADISADLNLPIAWAFVQDSGTLGVSSSNVTSVTYDGSRYVIEFSDISYFWTDFVTQVTLSDDTGFDVTTNSVSGNLLVQIRDSAGNPVQAHFQFVTFGG